MSSKFNVIVPSNSSLNFMRINQAPIYVHLWLDIGSSVHELDAKMLAVDTSRTFQIKIWLQVESIHLKSFEILLLYSQIGSSSQVGVEFVTPPIMIWPLVLGPWVSPLCEKRPGRQIPKKRSRTGGEEALLKSSVRSGFTCCHVNSPLFLLHKNIFAGMRPISKAVLK